MKYILSNDTPLEDTINSFQKYAVRLVDAQDLYKKLRGLELIEKKRGNQSKSKAYRNVADAVEKLPGVDAVPGDIWRGYWIRYAESDYPFIFTEWQCSICKGRQRYTGPNPNVNGLGHWSMCQFCCAKMANAEEILVDYKSTKKRLKRRSQVEGELKEDEEAVEDQEDEEAVEDQEDEEAVEDQEDEEAVEDLTNPLWPAEE